MLWDSNLLHFKKQVSEVLVTATGELALEQFLRDVRDHWISYELQFVNRDNRYL